jgi:predicted molibdopterin-dependent oxidoreductase YjgC
VITLLVDGAPVPARPGQTVAAALLAHGVTALRRSPRGTPRGVYCGIGVCQECRVHVEGRGVVRACVTPAADGMRIRLGGAEPR